MTQKRSYLSFIKIQIQIFNGYFSIRVDFMQMLYRDSKGQMIGFFFNISWSIYFWEFQVRIVSQKSRSDSGSTPVWLGNKKVPEKNKIKKQLEDYFWEFQVRSPDSTPRPHQYDLVTKKHLKTIQKIRSYFWEFQVRIVSQKSRSGSGSTPVWLGNKKVPEN